MTAGRPAGHQRGVNAASGRPALQGRDSDAQRERPAGRAREKGGGQGGDRAGRRTPAAPNRSSPSPLLDHPRPRRADPGAAGLSRRRCTGWWLAAPAAGRSVAAFSAGLGTGVPLPVGLVLPAFLLPSSRVRRRAELGPCPRVERCPWPFLLSSTALVRFCWLAAAAIQDTPKC
jgi:hypothetical protein